MNDRISPGIHDTATFVLAGTAVRGSSTVFKVIDAS